MTDKKVWFITGAGRGMGIDIAKAALAAGHAVVATGRDANRVLNAIGEHDNLLAITLDITDQDAADAAAQVAVDHFGRIDVLVNNAGNFYAGFFEVISPEQFRAQMETNFFGPLNVTRAILPVMRRQRSGHVITISSTAGLVGQEFCAAYAASKFALEGWMESLRYDVEPDDEEVVRLPDGLRDHARVAPGRDNSVASRQGGLGDVDAHAASGTRDQPYLLGGHRFSLVLRVVACRVGTIQPPPPTSRKTRVTGVLRVPPMGRDSRVP